MRLRLLILLFALPSFAWAENRLIPCVSEGKSTFLLIRTYKSRFLSSFVTVGGLEYYRWTRDEKPMHGSVVTAELSQRVSFEPEFSAVKLTSRGAFGLSQDQFLYVEADLLSGQNSGLVIEAVGDDVRVFECSVTPSQMASGQ
jgi:hypothetical protein